MIVSFFFKKKESLKLRITLLTSKLFNCNILIKEYINEYDSYIQRNKYQYSKDNSPIMLIKLFNIKYFY